MEKLKGPKPADHIWCARTAVAVSLRHFQSMTKVKAECVPASIKSRSFPFCGNEGLKCYLPHPKCLLSKPACTTGICPPKSGGVLKKNPVFALSASKGGCLKLAGSGLFCLLSCFGIFFFSFFWNNSVFLLPAGRQTSYLPWNCAACTSFLLLAPTLGFLLLLLLVSLISEA